MYIYKCPQKFLVAFKFLSNRGVAPMIFHATFPKFLKSLSWYKTYRFMKIFYTVAKTIERLSIGPILDMLHISLQGMKHFQGFKKASPRGMLKSNYRRSNLEECGC